MSEFIYIHVLNWYCSLSIAKMSMLTVCQFIFQSMLTVYQFIFLLPSMQVIFLVKFALIVTILYVLHQANSRCLFLQVVSLTAEGGRLRRDTMLVRGKDFELVPEVIWRALSTWYGGNIALPRTVSLIKSDTILIKIYLL